MSTSQISRRYARALFDLIQEGTDLRADLEKVAAAASADEVAVLLASPEYPATLKKQVIVKVAGDISGEIDSLVGMLAARGKESLLPEIHALVEEMLHQAESELEADVVVATSIDPALQEKLTAALTASTGKKVRIKVSEDKSILGGLVVRIGDRKIDYSLRTKLNGLRRELAS
ncbi:ATP synthase F1 subunit delta [Mariprofundus sp. KV]|uniref:ATP synthase F1 subunit delta n=1 Tax=Mariprofundus sp. KV TaxID=2608715 RepID=UPI0015A12615|nr:ATP synthase F1 subunit delta [Mariprofundus sp. KV]NWF35920.1 ATP synthase F1 subunit delta [Mariprofundus sp. KV]